MWSKSVEILKKGNDKNGYTNDKIVTLINQNQLVKVWEYEYITNLVRGPGNEEGEKKRKKMGQKYMRLWILKTG